MDKEKERKLDDLVSCALWEINDKVKDELKKLIDDVKLLINEESQDIKD